MWKTVYVVLYVLNLALMFKVEGVRLTIDPENSVTLYKPPTSTAQQSRIFTCGNIQTNLDNMQFVRLSIQRMTKREMNTRAGEPVTIAVVVAGQGFKRPDDVIDIQDRNRVPEDGISGTINTLDYRQSTLSIKFNTVAIKCDDAGQYFCNLDYVDMEFHNMPTISDTMHLTVSAIPDRVSLTGQPEIRRGGDGSFNYPWQMNVGDVIEFTCNGRIGSDRNAQWEWKTTGDSGDLIKLVPSSMVYRNHVNETRGSAVPVDAECTNTRTTTLRYTITSNDQNIKADKVRFQCFIKNHGANISSSFVYVQVGSVPVECTCKDCDADKKAAIVAACMSVVIAVLSAALVYILIRQQKCFKTKENLTYETPQRSGGATLTYDTLHQPGDSYEVPVPSNPHTYTNTNI